MKRTTDILDGYGLEVGVTPDGADIIATDPDTGHAVHIPLAWEGVRALGAGLTELAAREGTPVPDEVLRDSAMEPPAPARGTPTPTDDVAAALGELDTPPEEPDDSPRCKRCGSRDFADCTALPNGPASADPDVVAEFAEGGCRLAAHVVKEAR